MGGGGWLIEHELLASLVEVGVKSAGGKKAKDFKIPRPKPERAPSKKSAAAKLLDIGRKLNTGR